MNQSKSKRDFFKFVQRIPASGSGSDRTLGLIFGEKPSLERAIKMGGGGVSHSEQPPYK